MPCKIQIKQNLQTTIEQKTDRGLNMSLANANNLAKKVNSEYKTEVVRFRQAGDYIDRDINISNELVDKYYDFEKQLEEADARMQQKIDAERAGINYSDEYLFFQTEGVETGQVEVDGLLLHKLTLPLRKAMKAQVIESRKENMVVLSTMERLFAKNPDRYTYIGSNGRLHLSSTNLYKDIIKELGEGVIPKKTREEIQKFTDDLNNPANYQTKIKKREKSLRNTVLKSRMNLILIEKAIESSDLGKKFHALVNNSMWMHEQTGKVDRSFRLKGENGEIYSYQYSNGELEGIYKRYTREERGRWLEGFDDIENEDDQIAAQLALQKFKKNGDRLNKALEFINVKNLQRNIELAEKELYDPERMEKWVQEEIDYQREAMQFSESDIAEVGVENMIRDVLIGNNIINDQSEFVSPLGFTADGILNTKQDIAYQELKSKQEKIIEILSNKEEYNTELDQFEEDGYIAAPMPGWFVNAVSVANTGKIMDEHTGMTGGLVRGMIYMDAQQQYDAMMDKGETPAFQTLADTIDLNSMLPQGIEFADKRDNRFDLAMLNQTKGMKMSKASPDTIAKVKEVAQKMGLSITSLGEYLKGNPNVPRTGINALADLYKGVIAIASGKEAQAITEETIHVATAILEQTNPELITSLISKINKFKIYKRTFEEYKGKKSYQLANGKPNIRKIKKEAVDKLIAEIIVQESPDVEANPELLSLTLLEQIKQWWKEILNAIKGKYVATQIDIFKDTADQIMNVGVSGTVKDVTSKEIFLQVEENSAVNNLYNSILNKAKDIILHPEIPGGKKRHYTYKTKEVAMSVTEKIKKNVNMPERTGVNKLLDDAKRDWGSEGHEYVANFITTNLIDENGYALPTAKNEKIDTKLPEKAQSILASFAKELISSYPEGTRFLIETKVVNEAVPGMLASAIDFMAIIPRVVNEQPSVEVEVLDWKFTALDPSLTDDIPWYKQKEWKQQMGEYSKMLVNYGVKGKQITKARMIPFIMDYRLKERNKPEEGLRIKSIEIGNLNNLKETKLYLLPVALDSETTGFGMIDDLVSGLRAEWNKIYERLTPEEDKPAKNIELNEMAKAIRLLHMRLDFEPLLGVSKTFLTNAKKVIDSFVDIDYSQLSEEEVRVKLKDLKEIKNSADKYDLLANAFKLVMDPEAKQDKKLLTELSRIDTSVETLQKKITELQGQYAVQLGIISGLTTKETQDEVLASERPIDKLSYSFLEASKLPAQLIKMGANMIMEVKNEVIIAYNQKMNEFRKILIPLEKVAASKGKKAFDLIAKKTDKGLNLVKKLDSEFIQEVQEAKAKKDKKFFLKHMDKKKYEQLLKETLEENEKAITSRVWYPLDDKANKERKQYEIKRLRDRVDIRRESFNGWTTGHFGYLFYNSINEENHYSPEFREIKANPAVYKAWQFFTELNEEAQKLGYLGKHSLSFFPMIEATSIEKLAQTDNVFREGKDLFADLYQVRINEAQNYSKVDPETGRVKKTIPKYYTATDKQVNQLSTNLDMVGAMWIKSILDYKASKDLEFSLLTLHDVEKAKGNLALDKGNIVFQGDTPLQEKDSTRNADVFEAIIDDAVYFIREDLNSWGAQKVSAISSMGSTSEEKAENRAVSAKKGIRTADILFRSLAIGLKPLIGLANYFGLQFQSFINAGTFYKFREFEKNNMLVTSNLLSKEQKALLHLVMPLNEDIVAEKRRDVAREKGSVMKWLSTWTFTDVMMSTNAFPERLLQYANATSMNENAMVVDGEIVNIRQHLAAEDRKVKYKMTQKERKALERTFEDRVRKLKETKSLPKVVQITEDGISLPGVDNKALARHRLKTVEYGRKLSGLMSEDNKMGYRRDTIVSSFMMFKSWIPKHVGTRIHGINKNLELDQWEYGKTRLLFKLIHELGLRNMGAIQDIMVGNEKGLAHMRDILEKKKISYFNATGKELTISEEEFFDLVRTELKNQMKELYVLVSITALTLKIAAMEPPEDATDYEKNRYKWWAKLFNKTADEIQFYYNPASFDAFTKGSILPSLNLILKVRRAFAQLGKETKGYIIDDQEMMDSAHPVKYFLNLVPGASQFQNEILPYFYPELAKELGIRVTKENRMR